MGLWCHRKQGSQKRDVYSTTLIIINEERYLSLFGLRSVWLARYGDDG